LSPNIKYLDNSFHEGFILGLQKVAVYTEHEVFGRYFRPSKRKRRFGGITFKELSKINYGDFMVHQNFGIGKYAGLKKVTTGGVQQESVKLLYQNNDVVFVNLNSLDQVKKYSAQEGVTPKLSKLGGNEWDRIKQRTKKKIQDIAKDLILLYAKRKSQKGFKFSADSVWQKELEASFIYEDTPDQITATEAIKSDMESPHPMDRLVCGDVGFGKTEVAIRAAFKAVLDNKQIAFLVPTTILAEQHYNTFKDRLSNWAVEVEHLSRFKTKKEQKEILEKLKEGKINIIIGTHRLLSKDVKFKELGLLVIDEEQRFGVKAKEQLKFMRESIDVLTLTATPIPRTLNFSLLGARDLSIINTPPKNRQPIHTEIINFDKKIISNAVIRELQRSGQVYFVNDRIARLNELAEMIEEVVPFAKVAIAHGQMSSVQLENVMMKFLEKKYNVLLCTKIIESGLDIPSVNTIIINRADNFGLAELYQLRGRVGRSNIKSFAYLITPPHSVLTRQAIRRLHALEEFTELGSGMNLALKDLEIRGAGNLLGSEQSGFISEMGFDMYMQILDEAIGELKEGELGKIIADVMPLQKEAPKKKLDVIIESDISMLIPEPYIDDENLRLEIYQRLAGAKSFEEIKAVEEEMTDRFGKVPEDVVSLLKHIELKLMLGEKGFEKISIHGETVELFVDLNNEAVFSSGYFEKVMNYINTSPLEGGLGGDKSKIKQTKKSLSLQIKLSLDGNSNQKLEEVYEIVRKITVL
jgi:transcription-repair coupling factor (superfamily II helicase)